MCTTFYGKKEGSPDIYTVSPLFTIPENDFIKYEMNYRQLGKRAAKILIRKAEEGAAGERMQQEKIPRDQVAETEKTKKTGENSGLESHMNRIMTGDGFQNW